MKSFFAAVLLLTFIYSGYSQVDEKSILGKWQLTKVRRCSNFGCIDSMYTYENYLILSPDYQCEIPSAITGYIKKGTWQLKDSIITIAVNNQKVFEMKILKLTPGNIDGIMESGLNRWSIYFVRRDQ